MFTHMDAILFLSAEERRAFLVDTSKQPDFPFLGETMSDVRKERMAIITRDAVIMFLDPVDFAEATN